MDKRTFQATFTYTITIDPEAWALAHGLDANDSAAIGRDMKEWLENAGQQSLMLPSDVTGSVDAQMTDGPTETTHRMTVEHAEAKRGCWLDGARGWTVPAYIVATAEEHGMPLDDDDRKVVEIYLSGDWPADVTTVKLPSGQEVSRSDIGDFVASQGELADKATEWLNAHVAPEGWSFGSQDGEFYLLPDAEWGRVRAVS
jgi:hypothetical protein